LCVDRRLERPLGHSVLNCADLFAGAGGFSLAARLAGLKVRLAVEADIHAAATYLGNICALDPDLTLLTQDIRDLSPDKIVEEHLGDDQCHLLLGGPPCQGFSTHRLNGVGVEDTRNDLIHVYFDFVRAIRPRVFLMENVPGMLWARHSGALDRFYAEGKVAGYHLEKPIVLDARDFGLPQRRKRVFILGVQQRVDRTGFSWPPTRTHGSEVARRTEPELLPWVDCHAAFVAAPPGDPNDAHMKHGVELIRAFERTPPNGGSRKASGRELPCHAGHTGHNDVYGRIDPSKAAPTMTTACINPSKGRFVHPTLHHGITVRQAARIQTFPDDFVFEGGLMAAGKQVGNAVPVKLAQKLIEHLRPLLSDDPVRDAELREEYA
jgi:DNA (cytosine-5)-methyltransferase 1